VLLIQEGFLKKNLSPINFVKGKGANLPDKDGHFCNTLQLGATEPVMASQDTLLQLMGNCQLSNPIFKDDQGSKG
jgi:hypothetical protein